MKVEYKYNEQYESYSLWIEYYFIEVDVALIKYKLDLRYEEVYDICMNCNGIYFGNEPYIRFKEEEDAINVCDALNIASRLGR